MRRKQPVVQVRLDQTNDQLLPLRGVVVGLNALTADCTNQERREDCGRQQHHQHEQRDDRSVAAHDVSQRSHRRGVYRAATRRSTKGTLRWRQDPAKSFGLIDQPDYALGPKRNDKPRSNNRTPTTIRNRCSGTRASSVSPKSVPMMTPIVASRSAGHMRASAAVSTAR